MMWAYVDDRAGEEISKEEGNDRLSLLLPVLWAALNS